MKRELLRSLDKIPAYCHQLLFTSRSLAVGQAACCRKVGRIDVILPDIDDNKMSGGCMGGESKMSSVFLYV